MGSEPENVTQLITKPPEEYVKPPRHVSKYHDQIEEEYKRGKSAHKTLGVPTIDPENPANFLRKRSKSAPKNVSVDHRPSRKRDYQKNLPDRRPVKVVEKPQHTVDITKRNVDAAMHMKSRRTKLFYVDDRHGTRRPLKYSGLLPIYIYREDYGKVPGKDFSGPRRRSTWGEMALPTTMRRSEFEGEIQRRKTSPMRKSSPRRRPGASRREMEKGKKSKDLKFSSRGRYSPGRVGDQRQQGMRRPEGRSSRRKTSPRPGDKRRETKRDGEPETEEEKIERERKKSEREARKSEREARKSERERKKSEREKRKSEREIRKSEREIRKSEREKRKSERKLAGEEVEDEEDDEEDIETEKSESSEEEDVTDEEIKQESSTTSDEKSKSETTDEKSQGTRSTKSTISRKSEATESAMSVEYKKPQCRYVTEDERAELLYGMKKKWEEMMKQFQLLPFITDTQPKKKRKSRMEKDLLQLEKDIETIEKHPYIYVYSDPED